MLILSYLSGGDTKSRFDGGGEKKGKCSAFEDGPSGLNIRVGER